jgi:hypothetical protein
MGNKLELIEGTKFNKLTLIKEVEPKHTPSGTKFRMGLWKCECGNEKEIRYNRVRVGDTISCGCVQRNNSAIRMSKLREQNNFNTDFKKGHKPFNFIDGDNRKVNKTENYYITRLWQGMKQRCYNPNESCYKHYGERGIKMYEPWINNRPLFKEWLLTNLGPRPERHSIDRIDVNGDYEPNNLRWATQQTQVENRRCSKNNA